MTSSPVIPSPPDSDPCSVLASACRVWLVRELVDRCETPKCEDVQECFVLAVTAIEAAGIVGEDKHRRIIRVEEVCPISKLPDNKYKVVACPPKDSA